MERTPRATRDASRPRLPAHRGRIHRRMRLHNGEHQGLGVRSAVLVSARVMPRSRDYRRPPADDGTS
jgi:hypothetical protein